jgi:uncharacterized protein
MALRIGLVSDTHGLVRPEVLDFLRGCDHILHAGDIGSAGVLEQFAALAPLTAVRGNNDHGVWAEDLPETAVVVLGAIRCLVLHDLAELAIDPIAQGIAVVVSGHSHKPMIEQRGAVTYANPGSAGPRRFALPIAVGEMLINGVNVSARWVQLTDSGPPARAANR